METTYNGINTTTAESIRTISWTERTDTQIDDLGKYDIGKTFTKSMETLQSILDDNKSFLKSVSVQPIIGTSFGCQSFDGISVKMKSLDIEFG